MARIKVPAVLAGGSTTSVVPVEGETVAEVFENHAAEHGPSLRDSVIENGAIKEFINVYIDGEETVDLDTAVGPDAQIRVIPAASGGH